MLMHIPTMFLMVIAVSLTMACCTGALWRREQPEGLGYWALGLSLHGIAFILFILHGMLPYSLSVVLGNLLLVVAFALFCEAILQFQQRRMPRLWLWWPVVVAGPALAILPDAPSARAVVVACLCTYQASLLLAITFRERDNTAGRGQYFVMLAAALGIITAVSGAVSRESVLGLIRKRMNSPQPLRKGSEEAFRKGFEAARQDGPGAGASVV